MRRYFVIGLTLTLLLSLMGWVSLAQAQTATVTQVKVNLTEYAISMSANNIPTGKPVTYIITNSGKFKHEVVMERAGDVDKALEVNGATYEVADIAPGATTSIVWTVPAAGNYQLGCHITGHYESGMKMLFSTTLTAVGGGNTAAVPTSGGLPQSGLGGTQNLGDNISWIAILAGLALATVIASLVLIRLRTRHE